MTTKSTLTETQPLPAVETMAELVARDPARCYHHQRRVERIEIPPTRPASQWSPAALARLLRRVTSTGAKLVLLGLLLTSCQEDTAGLAGVTTAAVDAGHDQQAATPDATSQRAADAGPDVHAGGRPDNHASLDVPPCQPYAVQVVTSYQVPGVDALEYAYSCKCALGPLQAPDAGNSCTPFPDAGTGG